MSYQELISNFLGPPVSPTISATSTLDYKPTRAVPSPDNHALSVTVEDEDEWEVGGNEDEDMDEDLQDKLLDHKIHRLEHERNAQIFKNELLKVHAALLKRDVCELERVVVEDEKRQKNDLELRRVFQGGLAALELSQCRILAVVEQQTARIQQLDTDLRQQTGRIHQLEVQSHHQTAKFQQLENTLCAQTVLLQELYMRLHWQNQEVKQSRQEVCSVKALTERFQVQTLDKLQEVIALATEPESCNEEEASGDEGLSRETSDRESSYVDVRYSDGDVSWADWKGHR